MSSHYRGGYCINVSSTDEFAPFALSVAIAESKGLKP
jgi:hypothetical protein